MHDENNHHACSAQRQFHQAKSSSHPTVNKRYHSQIWYIVMKIHDFIVLKKSNVLWYLNISRIKYSIKCIWRPIKALKLLNLSFSLISESLKTLRPVILKVKNNGLSFHSAIMNRRADACYITKHTCNWSIEYCSRDYRQFDN